MPMSNPLGHHVIDNTPAAKKSIAKMRNARFFKTLNPDHDVLDTVRQNNPQCYVLVCHYCRTKGWMTFVTAYSN